MKITFQNKEIIDSEDCYLHDSSVISLSYNPMICELTIRLDTLLDEKTGKYTAIIILKNIQYIELNNQMISYKKYINEINGWELVELNEIEGYKKSNIFNKQKPFAVMFEFFCQAKLYVVATEIEFNRI
ncbi:hypothetical protein [Ruminococcus sp. Marseille-P6503]|uniref:hypothetical protein n=1 Tax=Ruminococcus sp. Marseille-P6503 TaxID=2364796 RepID=UPI000F52224F|nr:hypothetical protein [Ruminococcus sp. Marseille-P6503]